MQSAAQIVRAVSDRSTSVQRVVGEHIDVIKAREPQVHALAHFSESQVLQSARAVDASGREGILRGAPVLIKDVFDTADMPTTYNSPLYENAQPAKDAAIVALLRSAGAVVLGKATTVEFASLGQVPSTTNPHDSRRTPGGSSSGSAAGVAAGMAPLAIGTQTGGSTIRPASFCGVAAMKPTFGTVPVEGMRPYAPSLDTVGWMAHTVEDLALLAQVFRVSLAMGSPIAQPFRIGVYRTAYWGHAQAETRQALASAAVALKAAGAIVETAPAVPGDERLNEAQDIIMHGEGRAAFLREYVRYPESLHPAFRAEVENANGYDDGMLRWAYDHLAAMRTAFDQAMSEFDVLSRRRCQEKRARARKHG